MKKIVLTAALLTCAAMPLFAQKATLPQLSPLTQQYLAAIKQPGVSEGYVPGYVYKIFNGKHYISALLKVNTGFSAEDLQPAGVMIGTKAGTIWTAQIPVESIQAVTRITGISYIQLDEPVSMHLDSARKYTRVDSAQGGYGLPMPFTGKDVVVGIVDIGFDFTNPVFWDTSGTHYRVKRIWEQKATSGTPPTGFIYGAEIKDTTAMWAAGTDNRIESHGTHVAGIAAGSGFGSTNNKRFRGMAPASDVVLVGILPAQQQWINTGGSDIIDGVNYVYQYAASVGKPAVVNLSWGASFGPHDGTSLCSQAIENLTGAGKIFVTSAGNSGDTKVHIKKTFTAADTLLHTFPTYDPSVKKTWIDIWGDTAKTFCVKATLINNGVIVGTTGFVCMDNTLHQFGIKGSNNDSCFFSITATPAEFDMKSRAFITLYNRTTDSVFVTVRGTSGTINMWNAYVEAPTGYIEPFSSYNKPWATDGDTLQSLSDNACGKSAIAVGAYSTKLNWRTLGNVTYSYTGVPASQRGNIAPFSSVGPSQDGRMKPDIAAPGFGIVSSVNSFDSSFMPGGANATSLVATYQNTANNRNYYYAMLQGTSMSSPATAGIIALLLQANPHLTPKQVIDVLDQTAIKDNFTGAAMDNTWGGGKINAYAALKQVLRTTGIGGVQQNKLACTVFPNPNSGTFTIGFLGEDNTRLQLSVYDVTGRCVLTDSWSANAGYSTHNCSLQSFAKGVYIARISSVSGGTYSVQMAVK